MLSPAESSSTVRRVIPSSTPRSGERSSPGPEREDVPAAALGHEAVPVEQHRVAGVPVVGLEQRPDEVEATEVLHSRIHRLGRDTDGLGDDDVAPGLQFVLRDDRVKRHRPGNEAVPARAQVPVCRLGRAAGGDHRDHGLGQPGPRHAAVQHLGDAVAVVAQGIVAALGERALPTLQVIVEAEEPALPHVDHVVAHVGELEPHVRDRQAKLGKGHERAVHEADTGAAVSHLFRHRAPPPATLTRDTWGRADHTPPAGVATAPGTPVMGPPLQPTGPDGTPARCRELCAVSE